MALELGSSGPAKTKGARARSKPRPDPWGSRSTPATTFVTTQTPRKPRNARAVSHHLRWHRMAHMATRTLVHSLTHSPTHLLTRNTHEPVLRRVYACASTSRTGAQVHAPSLNVHASPTRRRPASPGPARPRPSPSRPSTDLNGSQRIISREGGKRGLELSHEGAHTRMGRRGSLEIVQPTPHLGQYELAPELEMRPVVVVVAWLWL